MLNKVFVFIIGFAFGAGAFILTGRGKEINTNAKYIQLKNDYDIVDCGYLKKGTILQMDKPMEEGFTRYILYLNMSSGESIEKYKTNHQNEIIPYWLKQTDAIK